MIAPTLGHSRSGSHRFRRRARRPGASRWRGNRRTPAPRARRRDVTITAPVDMRPFAVVSGDHNPIHTDRAAALLAGLESPIVHGMWLSAAAQRGDATKRASPATGPAGRLDRAVFGHGAPRRRGGLPRRARRNRPGRRDCGRGRASVRITVMSALRATGRTKTVIPRPGHPTQRAWAWRVRQGGPQGVGHHGQVLRHPGLLRYAWSRQPDHHRQRCATTTPTGCSTDAVHPGRDGRRRRSPRCVNEAFVEGAIACGTRSAHRAGPA